MGAIQGLTTAGSHPHPWLKEKKAKAVFPVLAGAGTVAGLPAKSCIQETAGRRRKKREIPRLISLHHPLHNPAWSQLSMGTIITEISASWLSRARERQGRDVRTSRSGTHTSCNCLLWWGRRERVGEGLVVKKGTWNESGHPYFDRRHEIHL